MCKFKVGQRVRVGGSKGPIEIVAEVLPNGLKLVSDNCTGFIKFCDCSLVPVKEYEQLSLF